MQERPLETSPTPPSDPTVDGREIDWTRRQTWGRLVVMTLAVGMVLGTASPLVALMIHRQFEVGTDTVNFATPVLSVVILIGLRMMMHIRSSRFPVLPVISTARQPNWRKFIGVMAWIAVFGLVAVLASLATARLADIEQELLRSTGLTVGLALAILHDAFIAWVRGGASSDRP